MDSLRSSTVKLDEEMGGELQLSRRSAGFIGNGSYLEVDAPTDRHVGKR